MIEFVGWVHTYNNTIMLVEWMFAVSLLSCFVNNTLNRYSIMAEKATTVKCWWEEWLVTNGNAKGLGESTVVTYISKENYIECHKMSQQIKENVTKKFRQFITRMRTRN